MPVGILATSQAHHPASRPQVFQDTPDHIYADIRTLVPKVGNAERAKSLVDSLKHEACFFSFWTPKLAKALLELSVCGFDDEKGVIDVWPGIVFAIVPTLGALLQGFVVPFLVLLDEALQTDVAANLKPQVVALQEQKEP